MKAVEQGGALMNLLDTAVNEMLPTFFDLIISFGILYSRFDSSVSLTMMTAFAGFLMFEILTTRWKIEPRRRYMKASREEARVMHQGIQGWMTVSYFNSFGYERHRFGQAMDAKLEADRKLSVRVTCLQGAVELIEPFTFVIIACMIARRVMRGEASPGDFVFFIDYWGYLIWPLKFLMHEYRAVMSYLIDAERLLALFQTNPTITDRPEAHSIGAVAGHVTFKNVFFAYNPRKIAVSDLTFSAAPGETVAFVGATGAGKSTITKLLLRFYDVASGSIEIDGNDIRDVTLSSLRDVIGVVPQDPLLFNATIRENLRYAKLSATDDEISEACRVAAIHDKIIGFPDGYDTRVGENGVKLSGGEVQRLAIARVVLRDPSILVLDEATSAVDTNTESNIQQALEAFKGTRQRTTFVIAHRLSTVVGADRILVLDEGRVVESGTHAELLARAGKYKALWDKQIGTGAEHPEHE
jgi:ABC-type transport system involved in Fe-S cluster assembly fused permease/ATPase subunit